VSAAEGTSHVGRTIRIITGEEPIREGEQPNQYMIGTTVNFWRGQDDKIVLDPKLGVGVDRSGAPMETIEVTKIVHRVENRGDHGIGWFDVFAGDVVVASLNERHVSEVCYDLPEQVPHPGEIPAP
jgi:hypothetical protein